MADIVKILRKEEKDGLLYRRTNHDIKNFENKYHIKEHEIDRSNNYIDELLEDDTRLLKIFFDEINDGISILNYDLTIVKTNQYIKENHSDSIPLEGKKCYQIYQKLSKPCPWCPSLKAIKTHHIQSEIVPYPSQNNPKRFFLITSYPIIKEDKCIGVIEHVKDITNFKKIEKSLRKSKEILNQLVENTNQVFYTHDTSHKITYISPKCKEMFGYTPDEMKVKWTTLATDHPMNKNGYIYTEKAIKSGVKQDSYNLELKKKNGTSFIVEVNESPIKDDKGNVVAVTGSLNDVSAKKIAEKKLLEKMHSLETFHEIGVQRELKMIQLKKEINSLCHKYGEPIRYKVRDEQEIII